MPQGKKNLIFYHITLLKCKYVNELKLMLGFGSFQSDLDHSRSYESSQCDLSCSHSNWNLSCGKSAGSEIPNFTTMEALLNGL
jgi:hypothetical protein